MYTEKTDYLEAHISKTNELLRKFLTQDQITSLGKQKMKEWSKETIIKCLKLSFTLGKTQK